MTRGFVTLADGNTATVGTPVRVITESRWHGVNFPVGYLFVVKGVEKKNLTFEYHGQMVAIPGGNCVTGW